MKYLSPKSKRLKMTLKIVGGILLTLIGIALAFSLYVFIKLDSKTLTRDISELLADVLKTEVTLKECRLNPLTQEMAVYGLNIKDRRDVDMLHVDTLELRVDVWSLLENKLLVYGFNLSGAHGVFYKERKDTAANYQFALDAMTFIKKDHKKKKNTPLMVNLKSCRIENTSFKWDVLSEEPRNSATFHIYDHNHIFIDKVSLKMKLEGGGSPGNFVGELNHFYAIERNSLTEANIDNVSFNGHKSNLKLANAKFKYQDMLLSLEGVTIDRNNDIATLKMPKIIIKTDNHKPRKNAGKPHRGAFDPGHINAEFSLQATATYLTQDSVAMRINSLKGIDHASGLIISNLTANFRKSHEKCYVTDLRVIDQHTVVWAALVNMVLSTKSHPHSFALKADNVRGHAILKDIAKPFAPALCKFTTPLEFSTDITGDEKGLNFTRIFVFSKDRRITVSAIGNIVFGKKSKSTKTLVAFNIQAMQAHGGIKSQILEHFAHTQFPPSLANMLTRVGNIKFHGNLTIPFRRVMIEGPLTTAVGVLNANILINSENHHMSGSISSAGLDLAQMLDKPKIGPVAFTTSFDVKLPRRGELKNHKGAIPVGNISGTALSASYLGIKIKNVSFNIISNGHSATGNVYCPGKFLNLSCDFSFDGSDIKKTLKVKPHVRLFPKKNKKSQNK